MDAALVPEHILPWTARNMRMAALAMSKVPLAQACDKCVCVTTAGKAKHCACACTATLTVCVCVFVRALCCAAVYSCGF